MHAVNHKDLLHHLYRNRLELDEMVRRASLLAASIKESMLAGVGYEIKALGSNEKEQQRKLEYEVINDAGYEQYQAEILDKKRAIAHLEAELDSYKETKQAAQWATRIRMVRVLEGKADMVAPEDRFFEDALNALLDTNTFPKEEVMPATDLP